MLTNGGKKSSADTKETDSSEKSYQDEEEEKDYPPPSPPKKTRLVEVTTDACSFGSSRSAKAARTKPLYRKITDSDYECASQALGESSPVNIFMTTTTTL